MSARALITGSRFWTDPAPIRKALLWVLEQHKVEPSEVTVVHGAARGADTVADMCFAFPVAGSIGTRDCIRRARAAGITVYEYGNGVSE